MATWGEILEELGKTPTGRDFDGVRRKYLVAAHNYTGRNVILYATRFTQGDPGIPPQVLSIVDEDVQGLMEVTHNLTQPDLDLILHSPGGSIAAAEAVVSYLRSKFRHIRVVVPHLAMSAATMIACAADVIVLGKHSFLGPIDPQVSINTALGPRMVPAQAIVEQFAQAQKECSDPKKMPAWLPMLSQYGPDLLVQCEHASRLSLELVTDYLESYMLAEQKGSRRKAQRIAKWLSEHKNFMTHGRHISRGRLEEQGLVIEHLEADQKQQDLFLSIFHATTHTFNGSPCIKIIENQLGKSFIKQANVVPPPAAPHASPEAASGPKKSARKGRSAKK